MENHAPARPVAWRFGGSPTVDLGGGAEGFMNVTAAVRSGDTIVVADAGTGTLHFYGTDGRLLTTTGQKGRGPGEFQHISWLGVLARDSIAAWDPLLRRLSIYTSDGRRAREMSPALGSGSFPQLHGVFTDGSMLIAHGEPSFAGSRKGAWRDTSTYLRIARTGEVVDTIGRFPGPEMFDAPSPEPNVFRSMNRPFGKFTSTAVHEARFYVGLGDEYAVTAYDIGGRPAATIQRPADAAVLTPREIDAYRGMVLDAASNDAARALRERTLNGAPFPRTISPIGAIVPDQAGMLWVEDGQLPSQRAQGTRWSVFDSTGRWIARAEGPPRVSPLQIGQDWILGLYRDDEMVDHVRLYRLERH